MENKVAELLKIEVSDEITAANIHAIMSPRRPGYKRNVRNLLAGKVVGIRTILNHLIIINKLSRSYCNCEVYSIA